MKEGLTRTSVLVAAIAFGLAAARPADASLSTNLGSASTSAGSTTFTYTLSFNPNDFNGTNTSTLTSGNYITFYDFSTSLLPTSTVTAPAGFTPSIQFTGFTASNFPGTPPADSAAVRNVTFTYTGPTLTAAQSFNVQISLPGSFTLGGQFGSYGGLTTYQTTSVVSTTGSYFAPVPEPAALALVAIGGCALARRRRRLG